MLKRIKYFQKIVQENSFSRAAEKCFISQSAISQQIKTLEEELGVTLITRRNRDFDPTPAGEYFYRHSLELTKNFDVLIDETRKLSERSITSLKVGFLLDFDLDSITNYLLEFTKDNPNVKLEIHSGDHEELFYYLKDGQMDLVFSDQRRAFSDEYNNISIGSFPFLIEFPILSDFKVSF